MVKRIHQRKLSRRAKTVYPRPQKSIFSKPAVWTDAPHLAAFRVLNIAGYPTGTCTIHSVKVYRMSQRAAVLFSVMPWSTECCSTCH